MKRIAAVLLSFLCLCGFYSCQKEVEVKESRRELLTGRKWIVDRVLYSVDNSTPGDITSISYKDCERDDEYEFRNDNSFERTDGTLLCGNAVALFGPYDRGFWGGDSTLLNLRIEKTFSYIYEFKVTELSSTRLAMTYSTTDYLQQKVTYTYEFSAKK